MCWGMNESFEGAGAVLLTAALRDAKQSLKAEKVTLQFEVASFLCYWCIYIWILGWCPSGCTSYIDLAQSRDVSSLVFFSKCCLFIFPSGKMERTERVEGESEK